MKKLLFVPLMSLLFVACTPTINPSTSEPSLPSTEASNEPTSEESTNPSNEVTSNDPSHEPSISDPTIETPTTKIQNFYHKFEQSDFTEAGGNLTVNGLTFSYSPFTFLGGAAQGVQVGSSKKPQTNLWTISTSFNEEVKVTSIYFELANASGGSGKYFYSFGNYSVEKDFNTNKELLKYGEEDLSVEATTLSFSIVANAKAIYFYSLSFSVETSIDSSLSISGDTYEAIPVVPGVNSIPNVNYSLTSKEEYYKGVTR